MYAKLFASIYQGTLRGNTNGLVVFTNLLAHADPEGWADIHPKAISEETGLTVEQVNASLLELESPDPDSRSPEEDGRRIIRLDEHRAWGWRIVNHGKYRAIRNEEDRREQNRLAQERWREKNKPSVSNSKQSKPPSAYTEADTEADTTTHSHSSFKPPIPTNLLKDFLTLRKAKRAGPLTETAFKGIAKEAAKAGISIIEAIEICCKKNWTSFDASWDWGKTKNKGAIV